ncbi:hypothetical protein [Corallococcus aberystwythensis]|uniref:Uncharacterized protein n=1 Tax=Corallococcus aberystwythensis TaxID=2316722 RepID=A0A3A8QHD9_9BACT|nr:hypothetical protein [Corallococcus aberystwythensis]RKH68113.1 hypothetical protein D7W81_12890 [Corallococcus aberystwythensis]
MRTLLKSLLASAAVLVLAPTTASAGPLRCILVCGYETHCSEPCRTGNGTDTTCGEYGWCGGDSQVRVTPSESKEPALVCSEEQQAPESTVSAES